MSCFEIPTLERNFMARRSNSAPKWRYSITRHTPLAFGDGQPEQFFLTWTIAVSPGTEIA
jgi:hypothetical protein